jgi:hypothetical protein
MTNEGRWIYNRGLLRDPCDNPGCKRFIDAGEYYYRNRIGVFCAECATRHWDVPHRSIEVVCGAKSPR